MIENRLYTKLLLLLFSSQSTQLFLDITYYVYGHTYIYVFQRSSDEPSGSHGGHVTVFSCYHSQKNTLIYNRSHYNLGCLCIVQVTQAFVDKIRPNSFDIFRQCAKCTHRQKPGLLPAYNNLASAENIANFQQPQQQHITCMDTD